MKKIILSITILFNLQLLAQEKTSSENYKLCQQHRMKHKDLNMDYLKTKNESTHQQALANLDLSKKYCIVWSKDYRL